MHPHPAVLPECRFYEPLVKKNQDQLLETPAIVLANLCVSCIMTSLVGWDEPTMGTPQLLLLLQNVKAPNSHCCLARSLRLPLPPPLQNEEAPYA